MAASNRPASRIERFIGTIQRSQQADGNRKLQWTMHKHAARPQRSGILLVLLAGMRTGELLLGSAADRRAVTRDIVEARWLGEYYVAWPQEPDWPVQIQRGESGPAVEIVMEMAALAQPGWSGGSVFDADFEAWLMAFQRRNGLVANGIVGPNTLIHLMAPTITEPRLVTEATENS